MIVVAVVRVVVATEVEDNVLRVEVPVVVCGVLVTVVVMQSEHPVQAEYPHLSDHGLVLGEHHDLHSGVVVVMVLVVFVPVIVVVEFVELVLLSVVVY